jgi:hypothetical protein
MMFLNQQSCSRVFEDSFIIFELRTFISTHIAMKTPSIPVRCLELKNFSLC